MLAVVLAALNLHVVAMSVSPPPPAVATTVSVPPPPAAAVAPRLTIVRAAASSEAGLSFAIQLEDGRMLLASSPLALRFFVHNRWCAAGRDGGLTLVSQQDVQGGRAAASADGLGLYAGHESTWECDGVPIVLGVYAHADSGTVRFTQAFPAGATGTNVVGRGNGGSASQPFGQHPAINTSSGLLGNMTFFAVSGNMNEYRERGVGVSPAWGGSGNGHQRLPDTGGYHPDGQFDSGPFVLFEEPGQGSGVHVVVSPLNNLFIWSQAIVHAHSGPDGGAGGPDTGHGSNHQPQCSGIEQDSDLSGGDILKHGALNPIPCSSVAACCALCTASPECTDFTWIGPKEKQKPYQNKCYLKHFPPNHSASNHRVGHISGHSPTGNYTPGGGGGGGGSTGAGSVYTAGIHYEVTSVPPGFNHTTVLYLGGKGAGVTETVLGWGSMLQAANGVAGKAIAHDAATTQLGAWTDAGTVYYRMDNGTNMSDILPRWVAALRAESIPVQYLQLDDWWYRTSDAGTRCIKSFDPMPQGAPFEKGYFSDSLLQFQEQVQLPLHLYHACFNADTVYRIEQGGQFRFDSNNRNFAQVSAEDSFAFYSELWKNATANTGGHFVGSEVDHQVDEVHALETHRNSTSYAHTYYSGMSRAAVEAGISLQYCMSTPRHTLGSIGMQSVTHARASYDNHG